MNTTDENVVLSSIVGALGEYANLYRVAVLREGHRMYCGIGRNGIQGLRCEIPVIVDGGHPYIMVDGEWRDVTFGWVCAGMEQNLSE